jgi:hypothetical protein
VTPLAAWLEEQIAYAQKARKCAAFVDPPDAVTDLADRLESTAELLRLAVSVVDEARLKHIHGYGETKLTCPICQELESFDAAVAARGKETT